VLCVIGCGNSNRSDDGVGIFVAQALQRHLARNPAGCVRVFDSGTSGVEVMFQARGADCLIVVDAATSGSEAGAIFKVPGREFESPAQVRLSLHDFRWQHALAAGRKIFAADFPEDVTVFLIEAGSVDLGLELGGPVRSAAFTVIAEIQVLIESYRHRQDLGVPS